MSCVMAGGGVMDFLAFDFEPFAHSASSAAAFLELSAADF